MLDDKTSGETGPYLAPESIRREASSMIANGYHPGLLQQEPRVWQPNLNGFGNQLMSLGLL